MTERIGLGMYTIYEDVRRNMADAFGRISRMGYRGIEFYGGTDSFTSEEIRTALVESGLYLTGWHVGWEELQEDRLSGTVSCLQRAGCQTVIVPCLGGIWNVGHDSSQECRDRWLFYIEWMNGLKGRLETEGMRLGYHNHAHEFLLSYGGKMVFDLLYENLAPDILMELDSGNCIEGGEDPAKVLERYPDRPKILHLKPYSAKKGFDVLLGDEADENDWEEILGRFGEQFEWLLVESESAATSGMDNAKGCMEQLNVILERRVTR